MISQSGNTDQAIRKHLLSLLDQGRYHPRQGRLPTGGSQRIGPGGARQGPPRSRLGVQMQQGLHLLAQGRDALQLPQHPQRDEIGHGQGAARRRLAHPRHSRRYGVEQVSQDGVMSEAIHQGLEAIKHGRLSYVAVLQQKTRAH